MALIGTPQVQSGSRTAVTTRATMAGFGRRQPFGAKLSQWSTITAVVRSGTQVTVAGQYQTVFNFSVQTTDTTTSIQIRGNAEGADGEKPPVTYSAPSTGDIINGCHVFYSNVTAADLLAGDVYLVVQAASVSGTENITWVHSQVNITRVGAAK